MHDLVTLPTPKTNGEACISPRETKLILEKFLKEVQLFVWTISVYMLGTFTSFVSTVPIPQLVLVLSDWIEPASRKCHLKQSQNLVDLKTEWNTSFDSWWKSQKIEPETELRLWTNLCVNGFSIGVGDWRVCLIFTWQWMYCSKHCALFRGIYTPSYFSA